MSNSGEPDGQLTYVDNYASDTNGFHVSEIVDSSRVKARKMVHRAIQVCVYQVGLFLCLGSTCDKASDLTIYSSIVASPDV